MSNEEIEKRKKENWIEVIFTIEVLGKNEEVAHSALEDHIGKMSRVKDLFILDKKFSDIRKIENPVKGIDEAYSQLVTVTFLVKNFQTLLNVVLTYGPSSIEILSPNKKDLELHEMQNICNNLAGIVHQFAAAGLGGILITPDEKGKNKTF